MKSSDYSSYDSSDYSSSEYEIGPLLHWIGGKKKLLYRILDNIPEKFNDYYEPFTGGGIVSFNMPFEKKCYINDINKDLINLYRVVRDNPKELKKLLNKYKKQFNNISDKEKRKKVFLKQRDRFNKLKGKYNVERAALYMFINKTCFNGLLQINKNDLCTSAMGTNINPTFYNEDNINDITNFLNKSYVKISNKDYYEFIKNAKKGDFIYLDPPYCKDDITQCNIKYNTGEGWTYDDHMRFFDIFKSLKKKGIKAMMSNSYSKLIRKHFPKTKFNILKIPIHRVLARGSDNRGIRYEALIMNY
tara:strand:- start:831 stop:1739 length:909 start_codon:yes stop_codon:yes gene_type:complete